MFAVYDDSTNEKLYQNKGNIECVICKLCTEVLNMRKYLQNKKQATNKIDHLFLYSCLVNKNIIEGIYNNTRLINEILRNTFTNTRISQGVK